MLTLFLRISLSDGVIRLLLLLLLSLLLYSDCSTSALSLFNIVTQSLYHF